MRGTHEQNGPDGVVYEHDRSSEQHSAAKSFIAESLVPPYNVNPFAQETLWDVFTIAGVVYQHQIMNVVYEKCFATKVDQSLFTVKLDASTRTTSKLNSRRQETRNRMTLVLRSVL